MEFNKKLFSWYLTIFCVFQLYIADAHSYLPDVSTWFPSLLSIPFVMPDYCSAATNVAKEQFSNPVIAAVTASVGTACLCGLGFLWYRHQMFYREVALKSAIKARDDKIAEYSEYSQLLRENNEDRKQLIHDCKREMAKSQNFALTVNGKKVLDIFLSHKIS